MIIASAPSVILSSQVRKDAQTALAAGQQVTIEMQSNPPAESLPSLPYAPDVQLDIEAARTAHVNLRFRASRESNVPGIAIGAGVGAPIGAVIGAVVLEPLKANHPVTAVLLNAALAVIGGAAGGAVGRDLFDITATYDHEKRIFGATIASASLGGDIATDPK